MPTKKFTLACLFTIWLSFSLSAHAGGAGQVYYDLGVFALDEGNLIAAEKHFTDAIQKEPDNPYYHHYLGKTYLNTKRLGDAIGSLKVAWKLNPDITSLQFDLAMAYYETGRYSEAEKLFSDLVEQDPTFVLARYYQGMSYFKQDQYGSALPPLLRSGEENESIRDNSYYFAGISHYHFNEPDKALEKLEYVESETTSAKLRQSARQWQEVIRSQQAKSARYNIHLQFGLHYDDNVRLDPINEDFFADEGDFVTTVYFAGKYKFVNDLSRKIGIGYTHYQTFHSDLSEFDLTAAILPIFYQQRFNRELYFSLQYHPAIYWIDSDRYLNRHRVAPTLLWRLDQGKGLRFSYAFTDSDYETDTDRSGTSHDFGGSFFGLFANNVGDFTIGALYGDHDAEHPDNVYEILRAYFESSFNLPSEFKLAVKVYMLNKKYSFVDSVNNIRRDDNKFTGVLELSRSVYKKWLVLQLDYRHTKNTSNIDFYSYKKNVTGLTLIAKF